jgi:hypothetical protein
MPFRCPKFVAKKPKLPEVVSRDSIAFAHVLLYISFPGLAASIIHKYTHFDPTWPITAVISREEDRQIK